ncbi:MAG TPA: hypothetical protein VM532_07185 [Burkholderiales bacterium]|nr:hypothetical protein [Burkholderiales bacterium]
MCEEWIADILRGIPTAFIALIIGSIAVWIAYRHSTVTEARFKLELFEKRHDVFVATWKFLSELVQKNPITTTDIFNFCNSTANAKFLFGNEIAQFLEEAKLKGIKLGTAEYTLSRTPSDEARNAAYAERHELVTWVENELKQVKDRFKPYLDLSSWR